MTKKLYSTFAMLSLFFMLAVVSVQAQSESKLAVNIPFDFQIGNKVLPAGEYSVKRLTQTSMLIRSADGQRSAIAVTPRTARTGENEKAAQERLVFHKLGNQYFLAQVWMNKGSEGRELNKSDAERQAVKEQNLAMGGTAPQKVAVAASAR